MNWPKALRGVGLVTLCVLVAIEVAGFVLASRGSDAATAPVESGNGEKRQGRLRTLKSRLASLAPGGIFAIIDTGANTLTLRQGDRVLLNAVVSAGSGSVLQDPAGSRQWVFDTPRGIRTVKSKITRPIWVKPDWAFIEEGEAVPTRYSDRLDPGAMGDYAIGLGEGYFIHGTLYTRLLGRNVTHGCVRVGDEDLKAVYRALNLGSRVILF